MRLTKPVYLLALPLIILAYQQSGHTDEPLELIERLQKTQAVNVETIIDTQFSQAESPQGFRVANPYRTEANTTVQEWAQNLEYAKEVCAIRFIDTTKLNYELQGFTSAELATDAEFTVTHRGRCGSCSTLKDLSIYLSTPDLTTPARQCSRTAGLKRKKQCFQDRIGFTPYCAESWAYNTAHTREECKSECIADNGFINLKFHRYPGPKVLESGQ
jgi:hypothetical protein